MGIREDFFNAMHARDEGGARTLLARHSFNPNLLERTGMIGGTPAISLAVRFGMHALASDLVARGADVNLYGDGLAPIHMAADPRAIEILTARGADVNAPWKRDGVDMSRGTTALHTAARENRPEMVEALLKAGANPNVRDKEGFTPLHYAASRSEVVARQLVAAGALASIGTTDGLTARELLEMYQPGLAAELGAGNTRLADRLLRAGAQPNVVGTGPRVQPQPQTTPLHLAAIYGNVQMAELLLEHGANPNAIDGKGLAPVHYATGQGQDLVNALVKGGANLQLKTPAGKTAADLLAEFGPELSPRSVQQPVRQQPKAVVAAAVATTALASPTTVPTPASPTTAIAAVTQPAEKLSAQPSVATGDDEAQGAFLRKGGTQKEEQEEEALFIRAGQVNSQTQDTTKKDPKPAPTKSLLGGQFVGNEKGEFTRVGETRVALVDTGGQIDLKDREADTVSAGLELAKAKGWSSIEIGGGTRFRREVWLAASEVGVGVTGYEPTEKDKEELQRRLQARGGSVQQGSAQESAVVDLATSLTQAQDAVIAAGKSFTEPNLRDGTYASKVFGETQHHVLVMADGRANTATAIEKSALQGVKFGVGEMLKVRFRDGKALAPAKSQSKRQSLSA